jgi:hypothetical protein
MHWYEFFPVITIFFAIIPFIWCLRQRFYFKAAIGLVTLISSTMYHLCRFQNAPGDYYDLPNALMRNDENDILFVRCASSRFMDVLFSHVTFVDLFMYFSTFNKTQYYLVWFALSAEILIAMLAIGVSKVIPTITFISSIIVILFNLWTHGYNRMTHNINSQTLQTGGIFITLGMVFLMLPPRFPHYYFLFHSLWHAMAGVAFMYLLASKRQMKLT